MVILFHLRERRWIFLLWAGHQCRMTSSKTAWTGTEQKRWWLGSSTGTWPKVPCFHSSGGTGHSQREDMEGAEDSPAWVPHSRGNSAVLPSRKQSYPCCHQSPATQGLAFCKVRADREGVQLTKELRTLYLSWKFTMKLFKDLNNPTVRNH